MNSFIFVAAPSVAVVDGVPVRWGWLDTATLRSTDDPGTTLGILGWAGFNASQLPDTDWE